MRARARVKLAGQTSSAGGAFIRWPVRRRAWQPESVLSDDEISAFLADGYVAVRGAVPAPVIEAIQDAIWAELGRQGVAA